MMKKSIKEIQDELIIEFSEFDDWVDKYTLIMSYSAELEKMLYEYKTDDILFKDCASKVWILIECKDNKVCFFC